MLVALVPVSGPQLKGYGYELVVRAAIDHADGRLEAAEAKADQLLAMPDAAHRWRVMAVGVKLASASHLSDDARQILLSGVDWPNSLDALVLMPEAARAIVMAHAGDCLPALPGIVNGHPRRREPEMIRLTPRQRDVLSALASHLTMAEIAEARFLSVETIRSTTKTLYRRLGVGDRAHAVERGRALGLF